MPSRATTQIAREIQKPSACWSNARAGGVPPVLIAPISLRDAVDSPSDKPTLDRQGCTIKQLTPDERLLLHLPVCHARRIQPDIVGWMITHRKSAAWPERLDHPAERHRAGGQAERYPSLVADLVRLHVDGTYRVSYYSVSHQFLWEEILALDAP